MVACKVVGSFSCVFCEGNLASVDGGARAETSLLRYQDCSGHSWSTELCDGTAFSFLRSCLSLGYAMLKHGPAPLVELLRYMEMHDNASWLFRIRQDFAWLQARSNRVSHFPGPFVDDTPWWELAIKEEWAPMITRICEADTIHHHYMARFRVWRAQFQDVIHQAGLRCPVQASGAYSIGSRGIWLSAL